MLGPTIWVDIFGFKQAIFPLKYPAIFTVFISFSSIILISIFDKDNNKFDNIKKFNKLTKKAYLGRD